MGVQILPLDFGLQLVLLVWQQVEFDKRIRGAGKVLGRQILALENFDSEGGVLKTVSNTELNTTQLLTHWTLVVIFLRTWRQLKKTEEDEEMNVMLSFYSAPGG